jgi:hypothetical protein
LGIAVLLAAGTDRPESKAKGRGGQCGVSVVSTTEVVKQWADIAKPIATELSSAIDAIERFANFTPGRGAEHYDW